jgi:amino-acid N-acetyltransferase
MKKGNYKIRPAEFVDTTIIFSLIKQYPKELLARPISDIVQNIDRFLVCEHKSKVVGTISWQIMPEIGAPRQPSVEIKSLAVKRSAKGRGIGSLLVKEVIRKIKSLYPAQIVALTFTPAFFSKCGFVEVPKIKLMHKIYAGCINCSKYDSPFTCPEVAMSMNLLK